MRLKHAFIIAIISMLIVISGCASWEGDKGVEASWYGPQLPEWETGVTTDADVIATLGPPSQIIALGEQTVFYYLHENTSGKAYIFILWNSSKESVRYDRAIFFFDKNGRLLKHAYSKKADSGDGS